MDAAVDIIESWHIDRFQKLLELAQKWSTTTIDLQSSLEEVLAWPLRSEVH